MVLANGRVQHLTKGLRAGPFRYGDITEWEKEEALKAWPNMRGLGVGENPLHRLSSFDTLEQQKLQKWTDDERVMVEQALLHGLETACIGDYIIVDKPATAAPWPSYPKLTAQGRRTIEMVAEKIVETVRELELDADVVVAYERENLNREPVISALTALKTEEAVGEPVIAA